MLFRLASDTEDNDEALGEQLPTMHVLCGPPPISSLSPLASLAFLSSH